MANPPQFDSRGLEPWLIATDIDAPWWTMPARILDSAGNVVEHIPPNGVPAVLSQGERDWLAMNPDWEHRARC